MMKTGIRGEQMIIVTEQQTAKYLGSGELAVFATPCMIALMENTAYKSVQPFLDPGQGTVGTLLNVKHLAATPVGMEVRCETKLIEIDRKRLVFEVKAFDACGLIGEGTHERFVIDNQKFMQKANGKLN
ncbi:MAG: thioesterase family protein [Clostridia bacterium]|nr:thioesterase family protein [Clostridia bacterium]